MLIVILALLNICVKHKFSPKLIFLMFGMEGKLQAVWIGFRTFNVIDVTCFRDPKCCLSQLRFAPIVCMHSFFFQFWRQYALHQLSLFSTSLYLQPSVASCYRNISYSEIHSVSSSFTFIRLDASCKPCSLLLSFYVHILTS